MQSLPFQLPQQLPHLIQALLIAICGTQSLKEHLDPAFRAHVLDDAERVLFVQDLLELITPVGVRQRLDVPLFLACLVPALRPAFQGPAEPLAKPRRAQ